ncbi:MAG: hypothetical protein N3E39_03870 [Candidatus Methanomethylicia archaeon]|nr:hypothetical protein [Candidatus Methanomethylicia archaeon]
MTKTLKDSIWMNEPMESVILSLILKSPKKTFDENELYEKIRQIYGKISYQQFTKALMRLEIWGKVNVSTDKKGQKVISLTQIIE